MIGRMLRWLIPSLWLVASCSRAPQDGSLLPAGPALPSQFADKVWFINPPAAIDDPRSGSCRSPDCTPGDTVEVEYQTTRDCTVRYTIRHRELGRTLFEERYQADTGKGQIQFLLDLPKDAPFGPGYLFEVALIDGTNRVLAKRTAPFELKQVQLARNATH